MGSDLYMKEQNWRQRPNYAEWDGDYLVIYQDAFYSGYKQFWRGKVTEDNKSLVLKLVPNIPDKPKPEPVVVEVHFTPEEYERAKNNCMWEHYEIQTLMKKAALGEYRGPKGC